MVPSRSSTARSSRTETSGTIASRAALCRLSPTANSRWMTRSCRSRPIRSRSSKQVQALLVLAGPGDLEGERRLLGEAGRQCRVHGVEAGLRAPASRPGPAHPSDAAAGAQGHHDRRAEARPPEGSRTGPPLAGRRRGRATEIASPVRTTCAASECCIGTPRIASRSAVDARDHAQLEGVAVGPGDHPCDVGPGHLSGPVGHQLEGVPAPGGVGQERGDLGRGAQPALRVAPPPRRDGRSRSRHRPRPRGRSRCSRRRR